MNTKPVSPSTKNQCLGSGERDTPMVSTSQNHQLSVSNGHGHLLTAMMGGMNGRQDVKVSIVRKQRHEGLSAQGQDGTVIIALGDYACMHVTSKSGS